MKTSHEIPIGFIGIGDAFEKLANSNAGENRLKVEADNVARRRKGLRKSDCHTAEMARNAEIHANMAEHAEIMHKIREDAEHKIRGAFAKGVLTPLFWRGREKVKIANPVEWLSNGLTMGDMRNVPHRLFSYGPACLFDGVSDHAVSAVFLDEREFERWLRKQSGKRTTGSTGEAKDIVQDALSENKDLTYEEALRLVRDKLPSENWFRNEIWPLARLHAGLAAKAPPGRKKKSSKLNV